MAIVIESTSTTNFAASASVVLTKPTGLAVGDLMVVVVGQSNVASITTPSNWSTVVNPFTLSSGPMRGAAFYKTADSSDVAASNFTFSGGSAMGGLIMRISGSGFSAPTYDVGAGGITPIANSLLIMAVIAQGSSNNPEFSNYAIATDNPTWTEQLDTAINSGGRYGIGVATAPRTQSTATGDPSASITDSGSGSEYLLFAISPSISVTVTPSPVTSTGTIPTPTPTGGAVVTVSPVTSTGTVNSSEGGQADWSSQQKSTSPTWTPQSKS